MARVHSPSAHTHRAAGPAVLDLIKRLEKADRGSPELSAHVIKAALAPAETWVEQSRINGAWCIYERPEKPRIWEAFGPLRGAPVTTSLDAALALAERVLPGWGVYLRSDEDGHGAGMTYPVHTRVTHGHVEHRGSLPLALCIAVLRATTPAEADSVGTDGRNATGSAPLQSPETPEGREERS